MAGGAGLVSVCDLAVAVPEAKFGYPEVRRGLVAAMVMPHLLRHVGERTARYLLLTGELIDAEEARRVGFVNAVAPAAVMETALPWARSLAEGGPEAPGAHQGVVASLFASGCFAGRGGPGQRRAATDRGVPAGAGSVLRQTAGAVGG